MQKKYPKTKVLQSRPPLDRMLQIHQLLAAEKYPTAVSIAAQLEMNAKSIHRDLEFMRDRMNLPLEYDRAKRGYYYTEKVDAFPSLQITEGELLSLLVAEKALQQYRGTTFEKPLLSALKKMSDSLPDTISINLSEWEQSISFRTSAEPILNLEVFDTIAKATAERKQLQINYRKAGKAAAEPRIVDPYHLANINGEWFLFGYCHLRQDVRTFAPGRIHSVVRTGKGFVQRQKFSLARRLKDSFGVHSPEGNYEVVLKCDSSIADFILEKKWHESQRIKPMKDGHLELRLRLSSIVEIQRWILAWGGKVKVKAPEELKKAIVEAARKLLAENKS